MSEINIRLPKREAWTLTAWQFTAMKSIRDSDGVKACVDGIPGRAITGLINRQLIALENDIYRITAAGLQILCLRKEGNRIVSPD